MFKRMVIKELEKCASKKYGSHWSFVAPGSIQQLVRGEECIAG
jgi:hypothetical protein